MTKTITCQQCGGDMKATKRAEKNYGLQVVGVLLFLLGVGLLFLVPVGTIIGIIVMILAAGLGYKKKKVWLCQQCGYFFERA